MSLFAFPPSNSSSSGNGEIASLEASKVVESTLKRFVTSDEKTQITTNKENIQSVQSLLNDTIKSIAIEKFTTTSNQKLFTFTNTYVQGKNRLRVTVDGVPQYSIDNYTETSNNSITFKEDVHIGAKVVVEIFK